MNATEAAIMDRVYSLRIQLYLMVGYEDERSIWNVIVRGEPDTYTKRLRDVLDWCIKGNDADTIKHALWKGII